MRRKLRKRNIERRRQKKLIGRRKREK